MMSMQNRQRWGRQREGDVRSPIAIGNSLVLHNDADKLFSLCDLYRRLAHWIESNTSLYAGNISRLSAFMATPMYEFSRRLLRARHFAIEEVTSVVGNLFSDENPLQTLYDRRECLIDELQSIPFAILWPHVFDGNDNWQVFAKRMQWNNDRVTNDIRRFCQIVAEIGMMTDVLSGKAADYGLAIYYSRYDDFVRRQKNSRLDDGRLARAIETSAIHLTSFSAWAVVYQVLCQDYGWDSDMAKFERKINGLEFHKNLKECKDVGKTLNNNPWMKKTIDDWPETKQKTFAQTLRRSIEEELAR